MSTTRTYLDYLNEKVDIAPANSQEELEAAEMLGSLMQEHGLEVQMQDFDTPAAGRLVHYILHIVMFVGMLLAGFIGTPVSLVGLVLAIAPFVLLVLERRGNDVLGNLGPRARSQNVIGVHRASGPLVMKGNRPIVIVAHYDTPNEGLLHRPEVSRFQPLLYRFSYACAITVAVCAFIQILGFLPDVMRRIVWIVGILASLPLLATGVAAVYAKFAPCTEGASDNKSSVAALLGVMDMVRPADDEAKRYIALHPHVIPEPPVADGVPAIARGKNGDLDELDDDHESEYVEDEGEFEPEREQEFEPVPSVERSDESEGVPESDWAAAPISAVEPATPEPPEVAPSPAMVVERAPEVMGSDTIAEVSKAETVADSRSAGVSNVAQPQKEMVRRGPDFMQSLQILPEDCEIIYEEPPLPEVDLSDLPEIPEMPTFDPEVMAHGHDGVTQAPPAGDEELPEPIETISPEESRRTGHIPDFFKRARPVMTPDFSEEGPYEGESGYEGAYEGPAFDGAHVHYVTYEEQYPIAEFEVIEDQDEPAPEEESFEDEPRIVTSMPEQVPGESGHVPPETNNFAQDYGIPPVEPTEEYETTPVEPTEEYEATPVEPTEEYEATPVEPTESMNAAFTPGPRHSLRDVPSIEPVQSLVPEVMEDEAAHLAPAVEPMDVSPEEVPREKEHVGYEETKAYESSVPLDNDSYDTDSQRAEDLELQQSPVREPELEDAYGQETLEPTSVPDTESDFDVESPTVQEEVPGYAGEASEVYFEEDEQDTGSYETTNGEYIDAEFEVQEREEGRDSGDTSFARTPGRSFMGTLRGAWTRIKESFHSTPANKTLSNEHYEETNDGFRDEEDIAEETHAVEQGEVSSPDAETLEGTGEVLQFTQSYEDDADISAEETASLRVPRVDKVLIDEFASDARASEAHLDNEEHEDLKPDEAELEVAEPEPEEPEETEPEVSDPGSDDLEPEDIKAEATEETVSEEAEPGDFEPENLELEETEPEVPDSGSDDLEPEDIEAEATEETEPEVAEHEPAESEAETATESGGDPSDADHTIDAVTMKGEVSAETAFVADGVDDGEPHGTVSNRARDPQTTIAMSALNFSTEQDVPEDELADKDASGLDTLSVDGLGIKRPAEYRPKPAPIEDPTWGTSDFRPPQHNIARRAVLFDLPDPATLSADPFLTDPDSTEPTPRTPRVPQVAPQSLDVIGRDEVTSRPRPHSRKDVVKEEPEKKFRGLRSLFSRKETEETSSMSDWLGVDDDFDAKKNGREIGSWKNFESDDSSDGPSSRGGHDRWKGGATTRSGFRNGGKPADDEPYQPIEAEGYELGGYEHGDGAPAMGINGKNEMASGNVAPQTDERRIGGESSHSVTEPYREEDLPAEPTSEDLRDAILGMSDDELIAHDIWFVATGASSLDHAGIKKFLEEHRRDVRGAFVVNLDSIGAGELNILSHEGVDGVRRGDRRMGRLLLNIARDLHIDLGHRKLDWADTDATPAMRSNMRATTIMGMNEHGVPALSHTSADIEANIDHDRPTRVAEIIAELIRRA
ncbi:MAG: M28 family peptidase [Olsenella sp.]|nr:M28 family peptidase [Olsenella sp.]